MIVHGTDDCIASALSNCRDKERIHFVKVLDSLVDTMGKCITAVYIMELSEKTIQLQHTHGRRNTSYFPS